MRILSIDGGGIRGLIPAVVLASSSSGRAAGLRALRPGRGTSTGGIIACAPSAGGRPAAEGHRAAVSRRGPRIFRRSLGQRVTTADGLLDEKHDDAELEAALQTYLGDTTLGESRVDVMVTAYDLHERAPHFFKSWRPRSGGTSGWRTRPARRPRRRRTSSRCCSRTGRSVDGGVFATNPAMCAYAEAARLHAGEEVRLVALGTGRLTERIEHDEAKDWGLVEWVRPLIDVVFDGVADTVDYQLEHLLGERHHRFQVTLDGRSDTLDDASAENLERLSAYARGARQRAGCDELNRWSAAGSGLGGIVHAGQAAEAPDAVARPLDRGVDVLVAVARRPAPRRFVRAGRRTASSCISRNPRPAPRSSRARPLVKFSISKQRPSTGALPACRVVDSPELGRV